MFYISNLFVCPNPPVSTDSVFPLFCALLRPSRCFTKLLQCPEQCLVEFAETTWTIPFAHWRNVYGEQATCSVTNALRLSRWGPRFKITRRSRIERSDTCGRRFIACFCGPRNGFELSLESVIIRARTYPLLCRRRRNRSRNFCLVISEVQ